MLYFQISGCKIFEKDVSFSFYLHYFVLIIHMKCIAVCFVTWRKGCEYFWKALCYSFKLKVIVWPHSLKGVSTTTQWSALCVLVNIITVFMSTERFVVAPRPSPCPPGVSRQCSRARNSESACQVFEPGLQLDWIYKRVRGEVLNWTALVSLWPHVKPHVALRGQVTPG